MMCRIKISLAESRGSSSFFINKSSVQIQFQALLGQNVKGGIWFPKNDSQNNTSVSSIYHV